MSYYDDDEEYEEVEWVHVDPRTFGVGDWENRRHRLGWQREEAIMEQVRKRAICEQAAAEMREVILEQITHPDFDVSALYKQIAEDFDTSLREAGRQWNDKPKLRLSHGKNCERYQWYCHNEPNEAAPQEIVYRFFEGWLWEAFALSMFSPEELIDGQVPVKAKDGTEGHLDAVVCWLPVDHTSLELFVVECKLTSKWALKKWNKLPPPEFAYPHQAANYLHAYHPHEDVGSEPLGVIWLVRTQEDGEIHTFCATEEELEPYLEEAQAQRHHARTSKVPGRRAAESPEQVPCGSKTKSYCQFREHCWKDMR